MSNLLSHKLEDLHAKTNKLTEEERRGEARQRRRDFLQVNVQKTDVTKIPKQQQQQQQQQTTITINGRNLNEIVSHLPTYLPRQHRFNYRRYRHTAGRQNQDPKSKRDRPSLT
ncbi:unnamed protein product [Heterobilharzia americana]|nr:unnamed protein product [Heterobilharzia americana]